MGRRVGTRVVILGQETHAPHFNTHSAQVPLGMGGSVGDPGGATLSNWFTIEKYGRKSHKLSFCPTVCLFCKIAYGDVGIAWEEGRGWLAITNYKIIIITFEWFIHVQLIFFYLSL